MHKEDLIKMLKKSKIGHWIVTEAADEIFEWGKWSQEIPDLEFPAHWKIKMLPPYTSAVVRFKVKRLNETPNDYVSVYLDCYNHLGFGGHDHEGKPIPYWEIYPSISGEPERFLMHETKELIEAIEKAIQA